MRWEYCEQWNDLLEEPMKPLDETEARRRHETGELYTAITDDPNTGGRFLVEVRLENGYVGVRFVDDLGRNTLRYNFRKTGDHLFLRKIVTYTYDDSMKRGGHAQPHVIVSLVFKPDGMVRRETDDIGKDTIDVADSDSVDVSSHWEPIPDFGEYDSITRWDRDAATA